MCVKHYKIGWKFSLNASFMMVCCCFMNNSLYYWAILSSSEYKKIANLLKMSSKTSDTSIKSTEKTFKTRRSSSRNFRKWGWGWGNSGHTKGSQPAPTNLLLMKSNRLPQTNLFLIDQYYSTVLLSDIPKLASRFNIVCSDYLVLTLMFPKN